MKKIIFALSIIIFSCTVSLFPTKNPIAITQVTQLQQSVKSLYNVIEQSLDRSFSTYESGYQSIDAQIHDILVLDSSRAKSKQILTIANDIKKRFDGYELYHKTHSDFNDAQATHFELSLGTLIKDLYNTEINLKD